jgi:TonB family protein
MKTLRYVCLFMAAGLTALQAETITGTVLDISGAVVPNAKLSVTNAETKASQWAVSAADGSFSFTLAPAAYRLDVEARGFRMSREAVTLAPGGSAKITPVVQLGRINETITVKSKGTPAYSAPGRILVGGNVEAAKLLKAPRVAYPEAAKARGATGTVLIRAVVLREGALGNPVVVSSPDPDLSEAALETVKRWQYAPTKLNGQPVETETLISVGFELEQ